MTEETTRHRECRYIHCNNPIPPRSRSDKVYCHRRCKELDAQYRKFHNLEKKKWECTQS